MTEIRRSALVALTPEQMFEVVNDIEAYPVFLPFCTSARVIERKEGELTASLEISKGGMTQAFTTKNLLAPPNHILLKLVAGPFSRLNGEWRFDAVGVAGCKVSLHLDFEFDSRLLNLAFGQVFKLVADRMVDAFCERAEQVYGG